MSQLPPYGQYPLGYMGMPPAPPSPVPKSVKVIAILAIIFGAVGLVGFFCSLPQNMGFSFGTRNPAAEAMRADPVLRSYTIGSMGVVVVIDLIELFAGVGALKLRKPARTALIIFSVLRLVTGVAALAIGALFIHQRVDAVMQKALAANPAASQPGFKEIMAIAQMLGYVIGIVALIWPILVLYYMNRPHVKAAFDRGMQPSAVPFAPPPYHQPPQGP